MKSWGVEKRDFGHFEGFWKIDKCGAECSGLLKVCRGGEKYDLKGWCEFEGDWGAARKVMGERRAGDVIWEFG